MTRIRAWLRLAPARRRLVREAAGRLIAARLRRAPADFFGEQPGRKDPAAASDVAWAVQAASRALPGHYNCLAQSRAASAMLRRRHVAHTIRVGVRHAPKFEAHAWVEHAGTIVVGDLPDLESYAALKESRR